MRDGFHWRDGLYFNRIPGGSVEVTQVKDGGKADAVEWQREIPPSEWASIVAAVSHLGETGDTYRAALRFHNKTTDD